MQYLKQAGKFAARLILPASPDLHFVQSAKGTDGFKLDLQTDEGEISTTLWLSPAAYDRTLKRLQEAFGFSGNWKAFAAGRDKFQTLECSIETEMENYEANDGSIKQTCKVKWLNPAKSSAKLVDNLNATLSRLAQFGGPPAPMILPDNDSDEIPF